MCKFYLRITGDVCCEVWQDIPGYEGLYQASTYGRIRSKSIYKAINKDGRQRLFPSTILKPGKNHKGYLQVTLCNGQHKTARVASLITSTFFPTPQEGQNQINHKDENKNNNRVENLEYCTVTYNNTYGTRIERMRETIRRKRKS